VYQQSASEVRDLSISLVESLFGVADAQALPPIPQQMGRARKTLWR
jgi:hypothetical protein